MKIQDFPASASAMPADSESKAESEAESNAESNAESEAESNALLPRKARLWIEWHGQLACEVMSAQTNRE
ncbi:MAG: hypothetical protein LBM04_12885 [Opitutaceae bacterium]|jgi:hypothetical protein|nr:hypothetical protein [Opitutaceae bacterium]